MTLIFTMMTIMNEIVNQVQTCRIYKLNQRARIKRGKKTKIKKFIIFRMSTLCMVRIRGIIYSIKSNYINTKIQAINLIINQVHATVTSTYCQ